MRLKTAAVEAVFEESLLSIWRIFPSERGDKDTVVCGFKERRYFFYLLWQVIDFSVIALCYYSRRHGSTDSFILVVSPL